MTRKRFRPDQRIEYGTTDEQYQLIGRLVADWSRLEVVLGELIWHFLKLNVDDGRTITGTLDARPKVRMLRELANRHIKAPGILTQLSELIELIEGLQEERNFIAHGIWSTLMPENIPVATSLRLKSDPGRVVTQEFRPELVREYIEIIQEVSQLLKELPAALDASQKTHEQRLHLLRTTRKPIPEGQTLEAPESPPEPSEE